MIMSYSHQLLRHSSGATAIGGGGGSGGGGGGLKESDRLVIAALLEAVQRFGTFSMRGDGSVAQE
eukprot:6464045-Prorocentrum_lima.AAC.1